MKDSNLAALEIIRFQSQSEKSFLHVATEAFWEGYITAGGSVEDAEKYTEDYEKRVRDAMKKEGR